MLRSSYDVVIVGTDLPALVFGALAAKKGYRVLVLGHGGKDNVYEIDGFRFVRRPHLLYGFADSNPVREVFRELALAPEMRNLPRPMAPTCNLVLPDARLEMTHIKGVMEEEISREYPGQLEAFRDFVRRLGEAEKALEPVMKDTPILPPGGIREYFTYRRYRKELAPLLGPGDALDPFANDPRLRAMFAGPLAMMSGIAEPWLHPIPFIRLANHLLRGLSFVEWGLDALKGLFLERIKNNSGDVRPADHVDMLVVRRGKVREVEIRAREEAIGVGVLVVGCELAPMLDLVPDGAAKKRYRAKVDRMHPTHRMVTLNVGAHRAVVPEGMAQSAFVVADPAAPLEGSNLLLAQVDPAMEPADAHDPDRCTIALSALMPEARFDGSAARVEAFTREMLAASKRLMPFLDQHLVTLSSAAIGTNVKTGQAVVDPAGLVPVYGSLVDRGLDLVTWPVRTAYGNVLYLGEGAAGPLGFEGAFLAAFMGYEALKKLIQLKNAV